MAEPNSPVIHSPTSNKNPSSDPPAQKNNNPKFLSSFLYKAILFAIFIALLPLFPPQFPESTNPTFLSRAWELIHLLLVGIAVSYGVFSRRNADPPELDKDKEKDAAFKPDANSYVSRILQISPAFDEDDGKAETWSSQYHRADPLTVESKPLLLPVRSLKKSKVDLMGSSSAVLSSPIPWRSRSGKMADDDSTSSCFYAKGGSFSSKEEDYVAEKSFHPPPSPPPPPPPPPFSHGSLLPTRREVRKSFKDELKDLSMKGREGFLKNSCLDSSPPRSVRTVRAKEAQSGERATALQQQQQKYQAEAEKKKKKKKKKVEFMEKMIVMSDESESDSSDVEEAVNSSAEVRAEAEENEVDKKADEFIAKFREQIRLQRIESIKKSSGHRAVKNTK